MKEIKFKNLDWYVIEEYEVKVKLLLKDVLDEDRIKKYSDDDWYIDGCKVRMSSNVKPPLDWKNSYIKKTILPNFLEDLRIDGEVDLLSKEEYNLLHDGVKKCNCCNWLKTEFDNQNKFCCALIAYATGITCYGIVTSAYGVRPTLTIDKDLLEEKYNYCPYCGRKLERGSKKRSIGQEKKE